MADAAPNEAENVDNEIILPTEHGLQAEEGLPKASAAKPCCVPWNRQEKLRTTLSGHHQSAIGVKAQAVVPVDTVPE